RQSIWNTATSRLRKGGPTRMMGRQFSMFMFLLDSRMARSRRQLINRTRYSYVIPLVLSSVLSSSGFKQRIDAIGAIPHGTTPQEFRGFLASEVEKWA